MSDQLKATLVEAMGSDKTVVNAARVSFGVTREGDLNERDERLINFLAREKHVTPFRHPQVTFRCVAPIAIARQLGKHQTGFSWNECFSSDTEVLTDSGWKLWGDVKESDLLATPARDGSEYHWEKPIRLISQPYKGDMYHLYSRDLDMLVTPNHDQWVSHYTKTHEWTEFEKIPTKDAVDLKFVKTMKMPSISLPQGDDFWIGKAYGAFIGDGSLSSDGQRIYFHVKKNRKKEMLRELSKNTPELCWNENIQDDGYSYFRIYNKLGWTGGVSTKKLDLDGKTKSFLNGLLSGLIETDGHTTSSNSTSYSTVSRDLMESIQKLGYLLGFDVTTNTRPKQGNWSETYKLTLKYPRNKLIRNHEIVKYDGVVYCAETSTGLLITRRNGKSSVVGNCSRRYKDGDVEVFIPQEIFSRPDDLHKGSGIILQDESRVEALTLINEAYEVAVSNYEKLIDLIAPEQARFVLPQGMTTEWIWTGSLYGWSEVCRQRLSEHAQYEVRLFAQTINEEMKKLYPISWKALSTTWSK